MRVRVTEVKPLDSHRIHIRFHDGGVSQYGGQLLIGFVTGPRAEESSNTPLAVRKVSREDERASEK